MGSFLPPTELCEAGFDASEKIKCIFSIAPVENFGEVTGVFFTTKNSLDAVREGTGRWLLAFGVLSESSLSSRVHRMLYTECSGSAVCASDGC